MRCSDGVMLDIAPLSLVPGAHGIKAASAVAELLDARNSGGSSGLSQSRPVGRNILYGDAGPQDDVALVALAEKRPGLRLMTASGAAFHAKGAGVPQELGWMLAALTDYLRRLEAAGMAPAEALSKITLTLAADVDMFATLGENSRGSRAVRQYCRRRGRSRHSAANSCRNQPARFRRY